MNPQTLIYTRHEPDGSWVCSATLEDGLVVLRELNGTSYRTINAGTNLWLAQICLDEDGVTLGPLGEGLAQHLRDARAARVARVMDLPEFDPEIGVGNKIGSQLHREMARAGIRNRYGYVVDLLGLEETPSFAALTADEVNAVRDAIYERENVALEGAA